MAFKLMTGESSKRINQALTFTTDYSTTHVGHIIHPIQLHLIKEIRKATHLAIDEQVY